MPRSIRSLPRRASAALLFLLAAPALSAQTATLVKDIDPLGPSGNGGPAPRQLTALGNRLLFSAAASGGDHELWASDGTPTGTQQISDACPGDCGSFPSPLGKAGGTLFWQASLLEGERQLWRSDGTRAGTFALTPAESGVRVELFAGLPTYALTDRLLLFVGCTEAEGCELWVSDGTLAGTREVKDFTPGPDGSTLILHAAANRVFVARQIAPTGAAELWSSDGTAAGTVLLRGFESARLGDLVHVGGRLFFTRSSSAGIEIWTSDGTVAGTRPLVASPGFADIRATSSGRLKASGDGIYFVAQDAALGEELWRSDGTVAGTRRLTDFATASPFPIQHGFSFVEEIAGRTVFLTGDGGSQVQLWAAQGNPSQVSALSSACAGGCGFLNTSTFLVRAGGRVLFAGNDGTHGRELWSSDGTQAGTRMVVDLCPGPCGGAVLIADSDTGRLPVLFLVSDRTGQLQLAMSDGTPAGTRRLTAFDGTDSSLSFTFEAQSFVWAGGRAYFKATDPNGTELWTSDGVAPAHQVADLQHGDASSAPSFLTPLAGRIAFVAQSYPVPRQVWISDGTSDGTLPFPADPPYTSPFVSDLTALGARLFFLVDPGGLGGDTLWASDGTADGTLPLLAGQHPDRLTPFRGQLYFRTFDPAAQRSGLGHSDGTPSGTGTALTFAGDAAIQDLKVVGDSLYYLLTATEPTPAQLWKSDGTPAGTVQLADLPAIADGTLSIAALGPRVYFLVDSALWRSDGTAAGTVPVHDHPDSVLSDLVAFGGALYYLLDGQGGRELWRSDGTEPGTVRLAAFVLAPLEADRPPLTVAAGRLYFTAYDAAAGFELWTSDGTAAGTRRVLDIHPGPLPSQPRDLTEAGGRLFFTATDARHGRELWQSDGTEAGTRLVHDIAPLLASSSPAELTPVGDRLYFVADDGLTGRELWSLPLGAQGCTPAPDHLCLGGDDGRRYRVEALWRDPDGNSGRGTALPLTADTGTFWFFSPSNLEVVIKVLNGVGVNGHTWVFYGALSDVQYDLIVTDTQTGLTRQYSNLQGQLASVGDTQAFGPLGAALKSVQIAPPSPPVQVSQTRGPVSKAGCQSSAQRLCLNDGRFAVEVAWKDFQGHTGTGTALPLTGDTGAFWFFDAANLELVVKALDGRAVNGHFWIFFGALSNVEYTLTVTDTQTGTIRTYRNPSGQFASVADTSAF